MHLHFDIARDPRWTVDCRLVAVIGGRAILLDHEWSGIDEAIDELHLITGLCRHEAKFVGWEDRGRMELAEDASPF